VLCNVCFSFCFQLEFQRVIRATLELPPATDAELEMLDILTKAGGGYQVDSDWNTSVTLSLARTLECLSISMIFVLIIGRACNVMA
jgi:hypothetical protein